MDVAAVVRRYFAVVADRDAGDGALEQLLHRDVRIVEHPNAINPRGSLRNRDEVLASYQLGRRLLSEQAFELHEVLVAGDRVAVRATWRGTLAQAAGSLPEGAELLAHIAALITVTDGVIRHHETYDCYEPLPFPAK